MHRGVSGAQLCALHFSQYQGHPMPVACLVCQDELMRNSACCKDAEHSRETNSCSGRHRWKHYFGGLTMGSPTA